MVVVIGLVAITIALTAATIYRLGVIAWSILLVGLFTPFAFGMYWKKANRYGAIAAFCGGFLAWILLTMAYYNGWFGLAGTLEACGGDADCGFWDAVYVASTPAFLVSIVSMIAGSLATQKVEAARPITDVDGQPLDVTLKLGWLPLRHALGKRAEEETDAPVPVGSPASQD